MFKQKTAYDMRISDWSSDVFSSVLVARPRNRRVQAAHIAGPPPRRQRAPPASALCPRRTHGGISGCVIASSIVARTKGSRARISPLDDRHADRLLEASRSRHPRSAERRVGQEWVSPCRSRWSPYHENTKKTKK